MQRCKHRHNINSHPFCFRQKQWYEYDNIKVGYFDIEVSDLKADNGFMLSWAIKERNKNNIAYSYLLENERVGNWKEWDDSLITLLIAQLYEYDLLIGYNSSVFDIPFIRAKCLHHNIRFFPPKYKYQLDLYYALRGKVALSRKSLKNMTEFLGIEGKTSLGDYWKDFVYGDYSKETLSELKKHNIADCVILEELHKEYEPYVRFNRNYV